MRRSLFFASLGLVAVGIPAFGTMPPIVDDVPMGATVRHFRDRQPPRGKGKRSTPRKRPNMLTVGKRVRRKHRRAA